MRSAVSTIPACLDALVAAATRALPGVQVVDGEPAGDIEDELLCVGHSGLGDDDTVVESTRTRDQLGTGPDHESYRITCVAYSWKGHDIDAKAPRDGVYAMVNALAAELASDPTMGEVVGRVRLATDSFAQAQTEKGAAAAVRFTVTVDAWTA